MNLQGQMQKAQGELECIKKAQEEDREEKDKALDDQAWLEKAITFCIMNESMFLDLFMRPM